VIASLRFSADSKRVLAVTNGKAAYLWDAESGSLVSALDPNMVSFMVESWPSGGTRILTRDYAGVIHLYNALTGIEDAHHRVGGSIIDSIPMAVAPDGLKFLLARGSTATLRDALSNAVIWEFAHSELITEVVIPPGNQFAVTSSDNETRIWRISNGSLTARFRGSLHKLLLRNPEQLGASIRWDDRGFLMVDPWLYHDLLGTGCRFAREVDSRLVPAACAEILKDGSQPGAR
jgi:WD40 repeat protein